VKQQETVPVLATTDKKDKATCSTRVQKKEVR
jgi:hypothetical protein